jgi:O-antigen/teichoic acid export membrane protein
MAEANITTWGALIAKVRQTGSLLRWQPFDTSTSEGRSKERHRRVALTALASVGAKGITVLTALISVPLTYRYLGAERYGLWMTISTVITMLAFADLGVGNGLLNLVSEAHGKNDRPAAKKYISSAFFMLLGMALLLATLFYAVYPWMNWQRAFNLSSAIAINEAGQAIIVFATCFLINLPLGVVTRIQLGRQKGFVNSLWLMAGNLLALCSVLAAISCDAGLPWLVLAMAGAPVLGSLCNAIVLFGFQERSLMPRWQSASKEAIRSLFRLGVMFFLIQISVTLAISSDNLVVAHVLDQERVAQYSIIAKMFGIIPMLMEMFINPLWPAYAESIARNDFAWVRRTLLRSLALTSCFAACGALVLVFFGNPILRLWVDSTIKVPFALLLGFGLWMIFSVTGNAAAMFLNGSNAVKFQAMCAVATAAVALLAKILLGSRFGLPGIIWGTLLGYFVCIVLPMSFYIPQLLTRQGTSRPPSPAGTPVHD